MRQVRSYSCGFTLIELLVVVAIIAVPHWSLASRGPEGPGGR